MMKKLIFMVLFCAFGISLISSVRVFNETVVPIKLKYQFSKPNGDLVWVETPEVMPKESHFSIADDPSDTKLTYKVFVKRKKLVSEGSEDPFEEIVSLDINESGNRMLHVSGGTSIGTNINVESEADPIKYRPQRK